MDNILALSFLEIDWSRLDQRLSGTLCHAAMSFTPSLSALRGVAETWATRCSSYPKRPRKCLAGQLSAADVSQPLSETCPVLGPGEPKPVGTC